MKDRHIIEFREDGWTIMHPTACRPDLFACHVNRVAARGVGGPPARGLGRYYCDVDAELGFVVLDRADGDLALDVYDEIRAERVRQDAKWGEQNHPDGSGDQWVYGAETARASCQRQAAAGVVMWVDIAREELYEAFAEADPVKLRAELVQLAAVTVAWIEAIDRRQAHRDR